MGGKGRGGGIQERRMYLEYVGRVGEEVSRTKEGRGQVGPRAGYASCRVEMRIGRRGRDAGGHN